ncbi:hypothetical protein J4E93_002992 [Alternaria ventricosa]|uniref:uncharacterized protein n=1 Tax=Alternaria ventricosa TaxID=1187951 RepID=UPI0020C1D2AA|nr:uncharacterized protein J4E93_002992 [Alternaria ventricosa]KAI4650635.1 hypothetical protein J4E93_002992 [Alternaria ventricosa]
MPPKPVTPEAPSRAAAAPKKKADTPKDPTSSQPAKKKLKFARKRKNDGNDDILAPGTDPKTFVQLHKGEGQVGSYAMFGRRDEFRRFILSSLVLNAIPILTPTAEQSKQVERAASGQWPFDQEQEKKVVSAFTALTGKQVPAFDRSDVSVKSFGPYLKYGESDLEPYSRAFNVIMS